MKNQSVANGIFLPRKAIDSKRRKKSDLLTRGDKTRATEGNVRCDGDNSVEPCEKGVIMGRLSQLELQVTHILKSIDNQ